MTDLVVTDTSCLIALDRIGELDLLPQLFVVHAPQAVAEEFGRTPEWLHVEPVSDRNRVEELLRTLDLGEAEAIVLAQSYPDARLLVDDARGRRVAERLGLPVLGTAGVLGAAKTAQLIPAVRPPLDRLIREHDFRIAPQHVSAVLRAVGEA